MRTCRFTEFGPMPPEFMISDEYNSIVICTRHWGNTGKNI